MSTATQPVLATSFQLAATGQPIPTGGGLAASLGTADGAQFDAQLLTGGTLVYSTAAGRPACTVTVTSSNTTSALWSGAGLITNESAQNWFRERLYHTAYPSTAAPVCALNVSGTRAGDVTVNANGTLSMRDAAGTVQLTTTSTVPLSALYRIEGYVTSSASAGQMELKLFLNPDSPTPTETKTTAASLNTTGGNLSQARFGMTTSGGPASWTFQFADPANSVTGYIGPGPVVLHMSCGAPTSAGFGTAAKPVGGTSLRLKVATDAGLTQNVTWVAAEVPDQYGYVQHQVTGLSPVTLYYCQLADTPPGGTEALCGPVCQVRTLPVPGTAASFTMAIASCIDSGNDGANIMAGINDWTAWGADLNVYMGDYGYADPTETTVSGQLGNIEYMTMYWGPVTMIQTAWGYYCRSDHDSTTDGGDSDNAWTAANLLAMQEAFPYVSPLPDPNSPVHGLYQSWVMGRVRFIMLDMRNVDRSPVANTDNSSKTMLGATQLAWLEAQLALPEPLKVIVTDTSWIGGEAADSCGPGWGYYTTERGVITTYVAQQAALAKNVVLFHGDAHGVACVPGPGNPAGTWPVYCAAPLRQTGAAFSAGVMATFQQVYNNGGGVCRLYGRVTVTDNGQTIALNFQGWDAVNLVAQVQQTDTFNVAAGSRAPAARGLMIGA